MQSASLVFRCLSNRCAQKLYQKPFVAAMSSGRDPENPNFRPMGMKPPTADEFSSLEPEKKRKLVEMEMKILQETGEFFVPSKPIHEKYWKELLTCNTVQKRRKYYNYLKHIEIARDKQLKRQSEAPARREEFQRARAANPHITYRLWNNSIFRKITKQTRNRHYDNNLRHAVMFGQDIVIDMGYDSCMHSREITSCVRQLMHLHAANKVDVDPFHLHLCNMPPTDSELYCKTVAAHPRWEKSGLTEVTSKSYLELFSNKEQLVYLTTDCRQDLVKFNHDDVYIIGCLVERGSSKPLSLAKAKKEGLRMARLPLERHLCWGRGNKDLTLDQVFKILLTAKNTGDWEKAMKHVPTRKLRRLMGPSTEKFTKEHTNGSRNGKIDGGTNTNGSRNGKIDGGTNTNGSRTEKLTEEQTPMEVETEKLTEERTHSSKAKFDSRTSIQDLFKKDS